MQKKVIAIVYTMLQIHSATFIFYEREVLLTYTSVGIICEANRS